MNFELRLARYNAERHDRIAAEVIAAIGLPNEPIGGMIPGMEGQQRFFSEPLYRVLLAQVDSGEQSGWIPKDEAASMRHNLGVRYLQWQQSQAPKEPKRKR